RAAKISPPRHASATKPIQIAIMTTSGNPIMTGPTRTESRPRFLRTVFRGLTPAVLTVLLSSGAAIAQDDQEPPALVGRISAVHGSASIQRADAQDWVDAGINEPVTIGDAVYAPQDSDVRLQI